MSDASDRSIPATARRREAARQQGNMPMAITLGWVAGVAVALACIPIWTAIVVQGGVDMLRQTLSIAIARPGSSPPTFDLKVPLGILVATLAVMFVTTLTVVVIRMLTDGISLNFSRALPTLEKISPLAGIGRIFSWLTLFRMLGGAVTLLILIAVAGISLDEIVSLIGQQVDQIEPSIAGMTVWRASWSIVLAAAGTGAAQWFVQRRRWEQSIRMTPQEFQEELRSLQADPMIRISRENGSARKSAARVSSQATLPAELPASAA